MPDRKKILLLCSRLDTPGGIERAVVNTAELFASQGHTVCILVTDTAGMHTSYYPIAGTIGVYWLTADFGISAAGNPLSRKIRFFRNLHAFGKKINGLNPDIVIASEYHLSTALVLSGAARKARRFAWEHHPVSLLQPNRFWSLLKHYSYRKLNGLICLNHTEAAHYHKANKVYVIPNFIQAPATYTQQHEAREILTIGWLTEVKGADRLPRIAQSVLKRFPDWSWTWVGDGPLKPLLERFIRDADLSGRFRLVGSAEADIPAAISKASLFVSLSRAEAFPMVLLEAMAQGVPCISFDCPSGPREIIQNSVDGLLVEADNMEDMTSAIETLISDNERRMNYGITARKNIQRFSPEIVMQLWEEVFTGNS